MRLALLALLLCASVHAAERHSVLVGGERVEIVDRGGLAIWQGDIVVGRTAQLLEATRIADLAGGPALKGAGTGLAGNRWLRGASGLFEIPYVVENDPDGTVPPAIAAFNQQLAGFARAVPRTAEPDYAAFNFDNGDTTGPCFSSIGRVGGRQLVGGARNCSVGRLVHELGHAMGLFHEQERSDVLRWVTIDLNAVDPQLAYNYVASTSRGDLGSYDYASIMHYGPTGFSKTGAIVMESIPPGIAFGQRDGYSRGDIDALHRLYGLFDPTIVVDTYPTGLTVLVDGVSRVTPASFSWPLGSTHTLEVAPGAQALNGVVHTFARWSSDSAATLAPQQTITVTPGPGTYAHPSHIPAVTVYTASFVRMKEIRLGTSGNRTGIGGTLAADPQPAALQGATGNYYRERQPFTLTPSAGTGSVFGRWRGSYSFPTATSTNYTPQMRGPLAFSETIAAYQFTAYFVDFPFATVKARDKDGDILGLSATVMRASGASASQRLPFNTIDITTPWAAGETGTVTVPTGALPWVSSARYVLQDFNGGTSATASLVHPATGQPSTTLVANYKKQFDPYRQVVPSCGGTIAVGANPDGWVDAGAAVPVTLTPATGWTLARWSGSLSGTGNSRTLTAADVPNLVAELNVVAVPLEIAAVSPATVPSNRAVTLEIFGRGFTSATRVFVAGALKAASVIESGRIVVALAGSDFPSSGKVFVTVQNRTSTCALNVSSAFEVFAPDASLDPVQDSDGDGIPNGVEAAIGTNPHARDNDVLADTAFGRRLFVMQQYRDFLGREGDAGGIEYWVGEMGAGRQTRASMAESFLLSPEYQGRVAPIVRLYFATYLRIPDSGGLDYWIGRFLAGMPLAAIAEAFAQAPEFVARYGNLGNRDYVTRLYQNILERAPDAAGLAFWLGQLDSGASTRGAMLSQFSESAEYRSKTAAAVYVTSMYRAFLRRAPDAGGFDYWRQQIASGASGQALVTSFLASPEYAARFLP